MKMKQLIDALPAIRKIAGQELHIKTLHGVSRLMDHLESELRFYDEKRAEIIEKYCSGESGKVIPLPGREEAFEREIRELLDIDIDAEDVKKVTIPEDEDIRISYADMRMLEELIEIKFNNESGNESGKEE